MHKYLSLYLLVLFSCGEGDKKEIYSVDINERALSYTLMKDEEFKYSNVDFSNRGIGFTYKNTPSYARIDSLNIERTEGVNISLWFQFLGDDPTNEQMLFSVRDTLEESKNINFWIAGRRLTAKINSNNLWAKNYDYKNGGSRLCYDLFQLELGKYYFLSINIMEDVVEVYVNSELYVRYEGLKNTSINYDQIYLGIFHNSKGDFKHQYQGYLRNLTIFSKTLNRKEIKALSQETYQEIFPYNDAFELNKFKIDSFE